jgi:hypothetical protein
VTGWLAPDGTFHQCRPRGHVELAAKLADEIAGEHVWYPDDFLVERGWIRLLRGGVPHEWELNQRQLDTYAELALQVKGEMLDVLGALCELRG